MQNKVSFSIDEAKLKLVTDALKTIDENLPGLIVLTKDERESLPKFGDKSVSFVEKALEFSKQCTEIFPPYVSLTELETDVNARRTLLKVLIPLRSLLERLEDTYTLAGIEAFMAALVIYDAIKKADHDGVPGLKNMVEELQKRFPGRSALQKNRSAV